MGVMNNYVEALFVLLPEDAGGRAAAVEPRGGGYCPMLRGADGAMLRIRVIEGPPRIAPGQDGHVVAHVETPLADDALLAPGSELDVIEDERVVGILSVARLWRGAAVA